MKTFTFFFIHRDYSLNPPQTVPAFSSKGHLLLSLCFFVSLCLVSPTAWAIYKVVGPNGKITYTDQPPKKENVQSIGSIQGNDGDNALPYALAQVVSKFPVTLYAFNGCSPCDQGRNYLKQRGIPFTEKSVNTNADMNALEQLTGSKQMPLLRVGQQKINGFSSTEWGRYLDAASYPAESKLPKNYRWASATALVEAQNPTTKPKNTDNQTVTPGSNTSTLPSYPKSPTNTSGIRF